MAMTDSNETHLRATFLLKALLRNGNLGSKHISIGPMRWLLIPVNFLAVIDAFISLNLCANTLPVDGYMGEIFVLTCAPAMAVQSEAYNRKSPHG
uniref:DUF1736 domain-containing protein n=1 Tax=Ascaris lumbricoides TaxID=6252 RepID=A0A0M3I1L2_ASCLU